MKPPRWGRRWVVLGGPVSSYTWDLFGEISQRFGIAVDVFHRPPPASRIRSSFAHETFRSETGGAGYDWGKLGVRDLVQKIDAATADAVLLLGTFSKLGIAEALRSKSANCPVVFMADTNIASILPTDPRSWSRLMAYRAFARFVTEAWTLGLSNEQAFRLLGFRRCRRLPFYSVTFRQLGAPRTHPASAAGPLELLTIARLAPEKNLEALIGALHAADLPVPVRLTLIGDGPSRSKIESLVRTLGASNVVVAGAVPHQALGPFLAAAHALIIPSLIEPWGNVVTEALGMGVPVLATPAVGAAVSLAGPFGGIRISDGTDERALRDGLRSLVAHYPSLAAGALEAASGIRKMFDVQSVAEHMVEAIGDLREGGAGLGVGA